MKTFHFLSDIFLASIATTIHWDPNFFEASLTKLISLTAAVLIETLSAPANSKSVIFWIFLTPPPTVKGTKHSLAVFLTISIIVSLFSFEAVISKKQISSAPPSL